MNYNAFSRGSPDTIEWVAPGIAIVPWWPKFELGINVYLRVIFTPIVSNKRASWVIHDANSGTFHPIGRGNLPRSLASSQPRLTHRAGIQWSRILGRC